MGRKAVRLEFEDGKGARYEFKLEGTFSKEKVLKLLELYELVSSGEEAQPEDGLFAHIRAVISEINTHGVTSKEVLGLLEDRFKESPPLAVISTYLRRLADRGELVRSKKGREWIYYRPELYRAIFRRAHARKGEPSQL